ncbi:flippase [archaeon]|nr:flippase [archaeon]NCP78953.1 flippase [archaeon]NCP97664.1 flippase [archaeon]NCQ06720.1 flippase [archaeon]NCQ50516.1 flippase [archaeon]
MELEEKRGVIRNIGYLSISKFLVYLLSIVTITLIPRYLGVENYGYLNFVLSFIGLFAIFGDLGINTLIFRDVSKNPSLKDKYFNDLFLPKMFLLFLVSLVMIFVSLFIDKPFIVKEMIFLGLFYLIFHYSSNTIYNLLSSLQNFKYQAYQELLSKLLYTVLAIIVIYFNQGLLGIFLSQVIAFFIVFLYLFFIVKKYVKLNLKLNISFFIEKLKYSWPFALSNLFTIIFFNFDKLFISFFINDFQLGLYSSSVTLISFLTAIISLFSFVFFNLFSKYSFKKQVSSILNKFLKVSMIISFPIFLGGILLSKEIIQLVFGSEYILASTSFSILLLFFFLMSFSVIFTIFLMAHNKEKFVLKIRGISTGINIFLNFIFIPLFGIIGAAITTVISEIINLIYLSIHTKKITFFSFKIDFIKLFLSSILMCFAVYFLKNIYVIRFFYNSLDILFILLISGFIYLILLFVTKILSITEIKEILFTFKK